MKGLNLENKKVKFKTPQEELEFLRSCLLDKENFLIEQGEGANREELSDEIISEYKQYEPKEVLHKSFITKDDFKDSLVLRLFPEAHDNKMEELLGVLLSRGISNALSVVAKINNPHIDDDFHRFLVQYLHTVDTIPSLRKGTPLHKSLNLKLFQIVLPNESNNKKSLGELFVAMEQFYAEMNFIGKEGENQNYFALEIVLPEDANDFIFYAAIPNHEINLFEKQLKKIHLNARLVEITNDYNIFSENGVVLASYATLHNHQVYSIKNKDDFSHNPMDLILNNISKIHKKGEAAAIQFVICPGNDNLIKNFHSSLSKLKNKKSLDKVSKKINSTIMGVNIRTVSSAENKLRAKHILFDIESSFNQFIEPNGNSFVFEHPKDSDLSNLIHDFSYRIFSEDYSMPLNLRELSTIFHFPYKKPIK